MATQDDFIRTALRVPPDLHKAIHEAAASVNRTFNAEIVSRLQSSFYDAGNSETKGKLIVALTTLRMLHRMTTDEDLKRDVGTMLTFMGNVDEGTEAASAAQALERLGRRSETHSGK